MKKSLLLTATIICTKALAQTAATPTFSVAGGTYSSCQAVTISSTTSGALVFYTADGTTPTLASTQYSAPVNVCTNQTLKAIAAVPGVNRQNAQNTSASAPGTFWKPSDCASFTGPSPAGTDCSSDNPGGSGLPTSTTHTSGHATPSLSGASFLFAQTGQVGAQTNVLWSVSHVFGACDACTNFVEDHYYYWPATNNASSNEDDDFLFDHTDGIRYMRGAQYCHQSSGCPGGTQGWDFWGNSNVPWTYTGVTAGGTSNVWHHFQKVSHIVPAERTTLPCTATGNWPYLYVDELVIDGVVFNNGGSGWKACANALPSTWDSVSGMQAQIDIASHSVSTSASAYWDKINYISTFPLSGTASAAYIITGGGVAAPTNLEGSVVIKGTASFQ